MNVSALPDVSRGVSPTNSPTSFKDWLEKLSHSRSKDQTRSLYYYGFQPLFDALAEDRVPEERRPQALALLADILEHSKHFISGYYTGTKTENDKTSAYDAILSLEPEVYYKAKTRNMGLYDGDGSGLCTPKHLQDFLIELHDTVEYKLLPPPEAIIGCACGSFEIVLAMSAIFGCPVDFIRKSKRRGDAKPLVIQEQVPAIEEHVKSKTVFVVEDFVCTGQSILGVMEKVQSLKPKRVIGLSMARNSSDSLTSKLKVLHQLKGKHGSYAYEKV